MLPCIAYPNIKEAMSNKVMDITKPTVTYAGKPNTRQSKLDALVKQAIDAVICAAIFAGACLYANEKLARISSKAALPVVVVSAIVVLAVLFDHRKR